MDFQDVKISIIGGDDTDVELAQYRGEVDIDRLHELLLREFPQLEVQGIDY